MTLPTETDLRGAVTSLTALAAEALSAKPGDRLKVYRTIAAQLDRIVQESPDLSTVTPGTLREIGALWIWKRRLGDSITASTNKRPEDIDWVDPVGR
jgi:hypothetical protein